VTGRPGRGRRYPARVAAAAFGLAAALAAACSPGGGKPASPASPGGSAPGGAASAPATSPPAPPVVLPNERKLPLHLVKIAVPAGLRRAPFDRFRALSVPAGWTASVYARVDGARLLASTPDGRLLVSQPSHGTVLLVVPGADGTGRVRDFITGLHQPHDMVFATLSGRTWLYVSESDRVVRYPYIAGDARARPGQPVITGLPDASTPELRGHYAHALKNLAVAADGTLYLSIASSCNACAEDTRSDPQRGAIYSYDTDGKNRRLVASGVRNAEGLALVPGTGDLWAVVNSRDNVAYPYHQDFDNKAPADDFGRVLPGYVDDHPPEEFVHITPGAFFGWPFCIPNPDRTIGMRDLPYDPDAQLNRDGKVKCGAANPVDQGIPAHTAPLGLTFLQGTAAPALVRGGAAVALHGSWNRRLPVGYKVVWFPWEAGTPGWEAGRPGRQQDLATGWLDEAAGKAWGRPVDVAVDRDGSLLVSDDLSGTIYRLSATQH
jgi:glucose/arabinose dehydrogenase